MLHGGHFEFAAAMLNFCMTSTVALATFINRFSYLFTTYMSILGFLNLLLHVITTIY